MGSPGVGLGPRWRSDWARRRAPPRRPPRCEPRSGRPRARSWRSGRV